MADEKTPEVLEPRLNQFREDYLAILTDDTVDALPYDEINKPAPTKMAYCFTINNPTEANIDTLIKLGQKYERSTKVGTVLIWELEVGWGRKEHTNADGTKHTGKKTLHIQGYLQLSSQQKKSYVNTTLKCPTAFVSAAKGSWQANQYYCSKDRRHPEFARLYEDPLFKTWGEVIKTPHPESAGQGERTDIDAVVKDIKSGMKLVDIKEKHFAYYVRYPRGVESLMELAPKVVKPPLKVIWHWGVPGSGKTYDAIKVHGSEETYIKTQKTGFWWDGYDPHVHKAVVIDEVDKHEATRKLGFLLDLMDENAVSVQIKGGVKTFIPSTLFLTSTMSPREIYSDDVDYEQIKRRCDEIWEYTTKRTTFCKTTIEGKR